MPTANAEGLHPIGRCVGKVSARHVFRHLQIDRGPRRSPSACAEMMEKKGARPLIPNAFIVVTDVKIRSSFSEKERDLVNAAKPGAKPQRP